MNSNSSGSPIDTYLAALPREQRSALEKLRRIIRAAAPRAEEGISYGLAAFRLDGRPLVAFGATANHLAFCGARPVSRPPTNETGWRISLGKLAALVETGDPL
jgi:hypothetical protein